VLILIANSSYVLCIPIITQNGDRRDRGFG
jgi:hypothetical protein